MEKIIIVAIIFVIIVTLIIVLYKTNNYDLTNKGNIIYYYASITVTCHGTSSSKYMIYDSGIIQQYSNEKLISSKKIRKRELKKLEDLIEKVSENHAYVSKKDSQPKSTFGNVSRGLDIYIYNKKKEKISLNNIESEELESLETFIKKLQKRYCKKE